MKPQRRLFSILGGACLTLGLHSCVESNLWAQGPSKGVALVIGNSLYTDGEPQVSGARDAEAVAERLRQLNFDVLEPVIDQELDAANKAIAKFLKKAETAPAAVFFYSGHGFQADQINYLMPINGQVNPKFSVDVDALIQDLSAASRDTPKFIFLDACRTETKLLPGQERGLARPLAQGANLLQAFATSATHVAESMGPGQKSKYTTALLRHLGVPGQSVGELLNLVKRDVLKDSSGGQSPDASGQSKVIDDFYFRDAARVHAVIDPQGWSLKDLKRRADDLIVILNGKIVMDRSVDEKLDKDLQLKSEKNELVLMVSSAKSFKNAQTWRETDGWSYRFHLSDSSGRPLEFAECPVPADCFSDNEDTPFKDGPHHGRVFPVARATIYVDPNTGDVALRDVANRLADKEAPFFARNQDSLYTIAVTKLPIQSSAKLLRYLKLVDFARRAVAALDVEKSIRVPDPNNVLAQVWGNRELKEAVETCMKDEVADRIRDAEESVDAFLGDKTPRPFESFDVSLSACVRSHFKPGSGSPVSPEEIQVWTSFGDS